MERSLLNITERDKVRNEMIKSKKMKDIIESLQCMSG